MAENEKIKFNLEFKFKNRIILLEEGITTAVYDSRLNIITLTGVLNENNYKIINDIQDIADRTARNIMSEDVKFKFKLIEKVKKQIKLEIDDSRVILYNEIYDSKIGVTVLSISIRGFSVTKMPSNKFTLLKGWNYLMSGLSVIGGVSLMVGGDIMALTVFATPVSGYMIAAGLTITTKNASDLSGAITNDFFMPAGMGSGDEGDFIKRGFEKGFGEKGEEYYNDFVLGFTVLTIYYDIDSVKNIKGVYKEGEIIFENGTKVKELNKFKTLTKKKFFNEELKNYPNIVGKFKDKKRGRMCVYGFQSRTLDYLGTIKSINAFGMRDIVILGNDMNGGRMFISQTYLNE